LNTLQEYLFSSKATKDTAKRVIMGNEAADLDSMASSIAYGYLLSLQGASGVVLPVMPICRADFVLRPEAVYLFGEAGIELDDIVFFDEVDFDALMEEGAGLVLVDHNKLGPEFTHYSSNVVGVVDHHKDEGLYGDAEPRVIQTTGSTTSLVAMEFQKEGVAFSEALAILLGGTILLDTVNLSRKAGRVTDLDVAVANILLPLCPLPGDELFVNIQGAKFDIRGFSTVDLLRKDYKEFHFTTVRCGIASVVLPVSRWKQMDGDLFSAFVNFAAARKLDVLLSMNAFRDPGFGRDLVVYCTTEKAYDALLSYLHRISLKLSPCEDFGKRVNTKGVISCFHQGNLDISRKKLQPLLAQLYSQNVSPGS